MYRDAINENPGLMVSRFLFKNLLLAEVPYVRVSRSERDICDLCMAYRQKLRMTHDESVAKLAECWSEHLSLAVYSRDCYNRCRALAIEN